MIWLLILVIQIDQKCCPSLLELSRCYLGLQKLSDDFELYNYIHKYSQIFCPDLRGAAQVRRGEGSAEL